MSRRTSQKLQFFTELCKQEIPFTIDFTEYDDDGSYTFTSPTHQILSMKQALDSIHDLQDQGSGKSPGSIKSPILIAAWREVDFEEPKFVWILREKLQEYRNKSSSSIRDDDGVIRLQRGDYTILTRFYNV